MNYIELLSQENASQLIVMLNRDINNLVYCKDF